jgi:AAA15 family ATPase/GTPase
MKNVKAKNVVLKMLREADPGIEDIQASSSLLPNRDLFSNEPRTDISLPLSPSDEPNDEIEIRTTHLITTKDGKKRAVKFTFEVESRGTRRLFSLIGPWLHALSNGKTLIVDELDVKLHHLLSVFLIKLFHDPTQNRKNAQLIFATHNVNLLDQKLFRRDQIWFTEKNPETNATDLYSLAEFSPRKDTKIQKGYLTGRYGAIPVIKTERIF